MKSSDGDKPDCRGDAVSAGTAQIPQSIDMEQSVPDISGMA
jgi:hypothetical protein